MPQVVLQILPGDGHPGCLESLCLRAIHDWPGFNCLDEYFRCLHQAAVTLPTGTAGMDKARAYAYLATQPKAQSRVGLAAQQNVWDLNSPAFEPLVTLLELLR